MKDITDILLIGVGNEILTDDGIGPKLVERIKNSGLFPDYKFEAASIGGLELLEFIQGYNTVIFIDAIKTRDGKPGDVYYYTPEDFKETLHLSNLHDVSFLTALKFGERAGLKIPEKIHIIAIEIIEDIVFSDEFSPVIRNKYDEIFKQVVQIIDLLDIRLPLKN